MISSTSTVDELFANLTETARQVIGAHQAICNLREEENWADHRRTVSLSSAYDRWRTYDADAEGLGIYAWACEQNRPLRMTQAELEAHPRWRGFGTHAADHPPMRGWLVVPLTAPDGRNLGLLQLSDRYEGEFTDADLTIAEFLAAIGSAALEHHRLLTEARQARSYLAALVDSVPGAVVARDLDNRVIYANQRARNMIVGPEGDLVGTLPGERHTLVDTRGVLLDPDEYPGARAVRGEAFEGQIYGGTDRHGRTIWHSFAGRPIDDEDGNRLGGVSIAFNISQLIESREQLIRREHLLTEAERIAGIGSWFRDIREDRTEISSELRRMFAISPDEVIVRESVYERLHPDDRPALLHGSYRALRDGTPYHAVLRTVGGPGIPEVVEIHAEQYTTVEGEIIGLIGTVRDMTAQREHNELIAAADRMEMIGRLAGGLAHDFNNLLTVLTGHADLLRQRATPDQIQDVDAIQQTARRAAQLTRQLLELGRRELLQPRAVDVNQLVDGLRSMARSAVPSSIDLDLQLCADRPVARIDPRKIEQVLLNLVLNARDALGDSGRIIVRTSIDTEAPVEETGHPDDRGAFGPDATELPPPETIRIEVTDDGPGMKPEVLERALEPFFTTKAPGTGTGLGLASAHGIVVQSRGQLELHSTPGHGTTAVVVLPRIPGPPETDTEVTPSAHHEPRRATILLAEDDELLRTLLQRTLEQHGHQVVPAADGLEAFDRAARFEHPIDLLISDVTMPKMNGPTLAQRLRTVHPTMRVILISGYTEDRVVVQHLEEGSLDFLAKPFRPAELNAMVAEVLSRPTSQNPDSTV